MSGEPMRVRVGGLGPPFFSPRLSTFAELLFTRLVRTVHAVPLKNVPLSRSSLLDGAKARCVGLLVSSNY